MSKITWDKSSSRIYETGIDRGVLYPKGGPAVAWNGLTYVKETTKEFGESVFYLDGTKVRNQVTLGSFSALLAAITYPKEFNNYNGYTNNFINQQKRNTFGLCYRTKIGNDVDNLDHGYKLHLVYNAIAFPDSSIYATLGDASDLSTFSWSLSTKPFHVPGFRATSHLVIDSTKVYAWVIPLIENLLYGTDSQNPKLPAITEVLELFEKNTLLRIIDHGDGTWSAIGSDDIISMIDSTTFQISWPTAVYIDEVSYRISSL